MRERERTQTIWLLPLENRSETNCENEREIKSVVQLAILKKIKKRNEQRRCSVRKLWPLFQRQSECRMIEVIVTKAPIRSRWEETDVAELPNRLCEADCERNNSGLSTAIRNVSSNMAICLKWTATQRSRTSDWKCSCWSGRLRPSVLSNTALDVLTLSPDPVASGRRRADRIRWSDARRRNEDGPALRRLAALS